MSNMWSLPWHELQKDLALGMGADLLECSRPAPKANSPFQSVSNSWLSRAQARTQAPVQARQ
jgi:hypothetical protein